MRVILVLHVGLSGNVRRRRQGRLITGRRVRAVHAVAVNLTRGRAAVRCQGPLHLLREAAEKRNTHTRNKFSSGNSISPELESLEMIFINLFSIIRDMGVYANLFRLTR